MIKDNDRVVALELINAGKCNMDCSYCYIPKTKEMNELHDDVVEYLESGKFIDDAVDLIGPDLEGISPWGTEPTLTLDIFSKWMPTICEKFPKFNSMNFSSNFMRNPKYLLGFLDSLPRGRKFNWSLQYSIDGPAYITDATRHKNATKRITENLCTFISEACSRELDDINITINCKATWDEDIITMMGQDLTKVREFYEFFDELFGDIDKLITTSNVRHAKVNAPFLGLPGKYTQQHGKYWADIHREIFKLQNDKRYNGEFKNLGSQFSAYLPRLMRVLAFGNEYYTKPEMFTCSAGDSQYALDHKRQVHGCHRTFYLNDDNYVKSITSDCKSGNWDLEHYKNDRLQDIRTNLIIDLSDTPKHSRYMYSNLGHHGFARNRVATLVAAIKLLAKAGQINKVYTNDSLAKFYAEFTAVAFNCHVEYDLTLGNKNLVPLGILKLNGNGAFETMLRESRFNPHGTNTEFYK